MSSSRRHGGRRRDIEIVGARANNLRDVGVVLPLESVTLIAGVSGSGKSSLLEDTLATEANRRMKRFLGVSQDHLEDSEAEAYVGPVPPSIHFSQGAFRASRRTTVGTCSGLLTTLRELFVRHGSPWADEVNEPVPEPSPDSYAAWLRNHHLGRVKVWAVPMRNVRGDGRKAVERLRKLGLTDIVVRSETDPPAVQETGRPMEVSDFRPLDPSVRHVIESEVEEPHVRDGRTLRSALETAFSAGGAVVVELLDPGPELESLRGPHGILLDSDRHVVHPRVATPYAPPSRPLFSFNQPSSERSGACTECQGLGEALEVALDALVQHPERSMHDGAFSLWSDKGYKYVNVQHETIEGLRGEKGFDPDVPWRRLPEAARRVVLFGGLDVVDRDRKSGRKLGEPRRFEGFVPRILERYGRGTAVSARVAPFVREGPCPSCNGTRWSREARAIRVGPFDVASLLAMPFSDLLQVSSPKGDLRQQLPGEAEAFPRQLHHLASSFVAVGLGHLSGDRGMPTVSEGESRRLRLAAFLHARGRGLALLLDEPARGLHEADIAPLVGALKDLRQRHTVVINDHRYALAPAVDQVIELGPGAGVDGGRVVRQGSPAEVLPRDDGSSLRRTLPVGPKHPAIRVTGAHLHNLEDVDCRIPLGRLVSITGVSGSGKSSFLRGILLPALTEELGDRVSLEGVSLLPGGRWRSVSGAREIQQVVAVEQRRPEPNRRSLVATFLEVADELRRAYAATEVARELGLGASDFGLNSGQGRCQTCLGLGEVEENGAGFAPCPGCGGRRFGEGVLAARVDGLNMAELLDRSVTELAEDPPSWLGDLQALFELVHDLDVGYLSLGRRMDRTSGGEIQRLRIANSLWRAKGRGMLIVLDEPTAGLHPRDVAQLLEVLDTIVGRGDNSVLVVEHNLQVIRSSDWVIDFGPGGGPAGGQVLAQTTPSELAGLDTPTGRALRRRRERSPWRPLGLAAPEAPDQAPTREGAERSRRWLKVLLGHEISLPVDEEADDDLEGFAMVLDELETEQQRPHEIGGLDRELARLILWESARLSLEEQRARLVATWRGQPDARLWIAPAVPLIQTWGLGVPASVLKEARDRLVRLHLREQRSADDPAGWRATGPVLLPSESPDGAYLSALDHALTVGAGFVELRSAAGGELAVVKARRLDISKGLVAPLRLTPAHLCRSGLGGCTACGGKGTTWELDLNLLVADRQKPPGSEAFLRREASAILKGVRRSVLHPFFRRLEKEGLWSSAVPWSRLDGASRGVFLFGYWCRPGPGSFLKNSRADPKKVASWLAWDGFFAHVLEQLPRSRDEDWAQEVRGSRRAVNCLLCNGTGLASTGRLVTWQGRTLQEWVASGTVHDLWRSLERHSGMSDRGSLVRERMDRGLRALAKREPGAPLNQTLDDPRLARETVAAVAADFLQIPILA